MEASCGIGFTLLPLDGAAESGLADELAQHLEDCYRESLSGGTPEIEAYRRAISELDGAYLVLPQSKRLPKRDIVPPGDAKPGNFVEDLWRDLRYAVRTSCGQ